MKKLILVIGIIFAFSMTSFCQSAEVQQIEGVSVFYTGQKPKQEYTYVATIDCGFMIKNYKASYLIPMMIDRAKKKYPNVKAIIFTDTDLIKCDVIELK